MLLSYIRVRAVVWAYGRGQTDTQTRVTTIHFASSTTHAKCNKDEYVGLPQRQKAIDGHDTDVPDGSGAHKHVQSCPDDTDVRRQRKISCNVERRSSTVARPTYRTCILFIAFFVSYFYC